MPSLHSVRQVILYYVYHSRIILARLRALYLEALSMAGGVAPGNPNGKVMLYRRATAASGAGGELSAAAPGNASQDAAASDRESTVQTMRLQQILTGDDSAANAKLHPGDVLYVQESTAPSLLGQIVIPILQGIANLVYLFR